MTFVICVLSVSAQNTKVITGAVIDKNGNPLPNALVEATGGAESVTTDADGSFRIEVPVWLKSLTAKYAGLQDKKIKLNHNNQIIFEMKPKTGWWFLNAAYSANFGDGEFNRVGLMGGYLGNWGGYAKVMFAVDADNAVPAVTAGVIKQVSNPIFLYLGAGYAPAIFKHWDYYYNDDWHWCDDGASCMLDFGAIFKFNHFNFNVGYSLNVIGDIYHSAQISVGYCF